LTRSERDDAFNVIEEKLSSAKLIVYPKNNIHIDISNDPAKDLLDLASEFQSKGIY
jgi:hypothetical protein